MEDLKVFSLSEICMHSSKDDCWLIINDKVYDVTKFLEEHPGGDYVLIEASGNGDATKEFDDIGHSSTATSMMTNYLIGVIEGSELSKEMGAQQSSNFGKEKRQSSSKPSSSGFMNIFEYLIPLAIMLLAFGYWYFLINKNPKA